MRGDLRSLGDHLAGSDGQCGATDHGGARTHGADPERDAIGVAIDILHLVRVEPEFLVDDLLEHRLVALTLILAAHQDHCRTTGVEAYLGEFKAGRSRTFDRVDD